MAQYLIYVRRSYKEASAADVSDELQESACWALLPVVDIEAPASAGVAGASSQTWPSTKVHVAASEPSLPTATKPGPPA